MMSLLHNPVATKRNYREYVIHKFPNLKVQHSVLKYLCVVVGEVVFKLVFGRLNEMSYEHKTYFFQL